MKAKRALSDDTKGLLYLALFFGGVFILIFMISIIIYSKSPIFFRNSVNGIGRVFVIIGIISIIGVLIAPASRRGKVGLKGAIVGLIPAAFGGLLIGIATIQSILAAVIIGIILPLTLLGIISLIIYLTATAKG